MAAIELTLDDDIVQVLGRLDQPLAQAARELIVVELYQREFISSGKAAALLDLSRPDFIQHTQRLGIPSFRLSAGEVKADADRIREAASKA